MPVIIIFICIILFFVGTISTFVSCYCDTGSEDTKLWINFSGVVSVVVSVIIIMKEAMS